ncbi:type VII secretion protein EccE [Mycobacterium sp. CPCC 205372]|uniref:Type VII secretion protein EccE n=1 Tax=Mycobacterium hippophais TaxID=3016340 RepID=A0ABT4PU18_9MYCO|nr:type VII secretion protein EccE [Mycobacterium hippophais]MCZ8380043.1 type VII secretion protein EccE [Mycobacterium hippophais]
MTVRITLAALVVVAAALAYPWQTTLDWWVLGVAAAVLIVVFAWWRGLFATTMVSRRLAVWRRNHGKRHAKGSGRPAAYATVVLRLDPSEQRAVPLPLIAGYVERYGIRAHKVKVVSHDAGGTRTTWVSLTLGAADNLAALQARSTSIPLHETAQIAGRRLTDHLREAGWNVTAEERADTPVPPGAKETWRGVRDEAGFVAAYRVAVKDNLSETLAAVPALSADTWTALEITGTAARRSIAVGCAVRTAERPGAGAPAAGLTPQRGRHRPALEALAPASDERLEGDPTALPDGVLDQLWWPTQQPDRREPVTQDAVAAQASM